MDDPLHLGMITIKQRERDLITMAVPSATVSNSQTSKQIQEPSSPPSSSSSIAKRAALGTLATLILRLVSFACTQWTFRVLDPDTLGRTAIQLELLHSTAIFLSREGFRLALTRKLSSDDDAANWNVAWLTVPVSTAVSALALGWHLVSSSSTEDPDFRFAGILYCISSCLEGWAEPAVLSALRQMNVAIKASAEGVATVGKTAATVVLLHYLQEQPVTAFGIAQVVYSLLYASVLYSSMYKTLVGPRWTLLDGHTCYMTVVFTIQGLFKHMLTEGDKIVLSTLSNSYDQGVYAMGSAYGSLAARAILQPIEENSRLLWSRQASQPAPPALRRTTGSGGQGASSVVDPLEQSYTVLVKLVLYIGFIFSFLAFNYTSILLGLLAGRKWGDNEEAAAVLSAFCVYTAFLAWNGTTEAFVYGVASTGADMGKLGVAHTVIGLVFATTAPITVAWYGTVGLVAANCLAMFCRSLYSVHFAAAYFANRRWQASNKNNKPSPTTTRETWNTLWSLIQRMFPHGLVILAFIVCFLGTKMSLARFVQKVADQQVATASTAWLRLAGEHVAVGASLGVGLLTLAYGVEDKFRAVATEMWRGHLD